MDKIKKKLSWKMGTKIVLNNEIKLWVIGKHIEEITLYDKPVTFSFSFCRATLRAGLTKKEEFTLGQDGIVNIKLDGFEYHLTKNSLLAALKKEKLNVYDFKESYVWLKRVKKHDQCAFTDATMNSIFRKTNSINLWINTDWDLNGSTNPEAIRKVLYSTLYRR